MNSVANSFAKKYFNILLLSAINTCSVLTSHTARTTHMVVQLRMSHMFILTSVLLPGGSAVAAGGVGGGGGTNPTNY